MAVHLRVALLFQVKQFSALLQVDHKTSQRKQAIQALQVTNTVLFKYLQYYVTNCQPHSILSLSLSLSLCKREQGLADVPQWTPTSPDQVAHHGAWQN